ncbi:ATP-binding protein [Arenibaculum pallidiluteum]|uniref:ATP-binding protein n=1 Tax=Arenibaculum pallidiluteum TaxID=2812559 RepID=UPI001A974056|nr:ATP-binding protein [Arenibaculum pallidiluteum]
MKSSGASPPTGLRRSNWLLGAAVTVLLLALWGAIVAFLGFERRQTLARGEEHALALSLAFEEQTFWLLASIEQMMNAIAHEHEERPDAFDLSGVLNRFSIPLDLTLRASLIGADGKLLATDAGPATEPADHSDREYFRVHALRPDEGIFVSKPVRSQPTGRWSIQITRRLSHPDGQFAGVLAISLDPVYFARFYQNVPLGPDGAIKLVGSDGTVRAFSRGMPEGLPGDVPPEADRQLMELWQTRLAGSYIGTSGVDGVRRINGYRQLRRYPLIVSVGLGETDVLEAWRDFATRVAVAGGGVSAAILVMAALLLAALRRRQRQEDALAEQRLELVRLNHDLAATQRIANLGSWELEPTGRRLEWSEETFRINGLPPEGGAPDFDTYLESVHPEDRPLLERSLDALFNRFLPYEIELRHRMPGGGWNHVVTRAEPIVENGVVVRARGSMLDITGAKIQEAELRDSRNLARQIADLSPNIIYILNIDTLCHIYGNRDTWSFFGYTREQVRVLGPHFQRAVVHPEDLPAAQERMARFAAMGDEEVLEYEQRVRHASGEWRWLWYREKVFARDPAGRPVQILGTGQDVTERKRNEMKLEIARREAEGAVRAREQFLATMSHEIRTPMTGVLGLADLLVGTTLTPEQRRIVDTLRGSASNLLAVLNDVLDFSKIEAGQLALEEVDTDLYSTVRDVRALYTSQASRKGLRLELEIAEGTPCWVRIDPTRLRQVLFNLIGNAIKFTSRGGVTVSVSGRTEAQDVVLLDFVVADTGIGMTEEQIGRLFQPFVQGDSSTTRRFGGTGLGLSISKSLVEALGGTITASSRPGEGSTFRFTVRCRTGTPALPQESETTGPAAGTQARILLAEDNPVNRMLITTMLERTGHVVDSVEDGRQAVDAVAARPYDLLLLDMQMPVMDGLEAAAEIRRLPGAAGRIPIVGLSADAVAETVRRARDAGFDDYVTKPVDWPKLHAAIHAAVAGRAGREPAAPEAGAGAGGGELPLIVENTARELESFFGRDGASSFYRSLLSRLDESLEGIRASVAARDAVALRAECHALRGAAGNMGAERLSAVLFGIEQHSREGVIADDLIPALESVAVLTRQAIEQRIGTEAPTPAE